MIIIVFLLQLLIPLCIVIIPGFHLPKLPLLLVPLLAMMSPITLNRSLEQLLHLSMDRSDYKWSKPRLLPKLSNYAPNSRNLAKILAHTHLQWCFI